MHYRLHVLFNSADVNKGNLLNLIKSNIVLNRHLTRYPVDVMELDFMQPNLKSEVLERLPNIKTIIAADGKLHTKLISRTLF